MNQVLRKMMGHGFTVLFISMCMGVGLLVSLVGGMEVIPGNIIEFAIPGDAGAWARAHVGGMLNGILVVVAALATHLMAAPEALQRKLAWMLPGTAYANLVFYIAAILSPNRALTFGDNHFGETSLAAVIGLLSALVFVIVSLVAVFLLAKESFKTPS
ncbi:styrene-oxide isomerase [Spongiibacter sp. IMCC21906]|uniref:styrene-oxide isomerase StyC n=1 Tax=Spongiibacter sp. IMCC21906 TaxID=1620392 RepID=UPI00062DDD14|nr:hypothetical protein [Spongiibacter sp. IMCC21906]AKH68578.1 styrene-oxide isomerase [Spongiibacter sp. IMCC21906]